MKKIIILIPIFNDWKSLIKLLNEINENISDLKDIHFECLIVNDASTIKQPKFIKPNYIRLLEILNMKENKGHARCNAFGIRYALENKEFDNLIIMDGDGEDRPIEIKSLIEVINEKPNVSVVAKRTERSESFLFRFLYQVHKLICLIFTGELINFGYFSLLTQSDAKKISSKPSLWSCFPSTVKKNIKSLNEINCIRGLRYFGYSHMSFPNLLLHSLSIIAVFKYKVFLRSTFMIIILTYLNSYLGNFSIFLQILIVFFNLTIFLVSYRESKKDLLNSHKNLLEVRKITH
jgi:hypothetical protein